MRLQDFLLLGIPCLFACGCQTMGDINLQTPQQEVTLDRQAVIEVERQQPLLQDPVITAYVSEVGHRVSGCSPRKDAEYSFKVIDSPVVNAFALPHGSIYIYTGLLKKFTNEAQLAVVLGHEVGHVTEHHSGKRFTRQLGVRVITKLVLGPNTQQGVEQTVAGLVGKGVIGQYSQSEEREADALGAKFSYEAGYNPDAAVQVMTILKNEEDKYKGNSMQLPFFGSHPPAASRIANLQAVLVQYPEDARSKLVFNKETYEEKALSRLKSE